MRTWPIMIAIWLITSMFGVLHAAEKYYVVKLTDRAKNNKYEVMTPDQLKQLEKQIQIENRAFPKALTICQKEWKMREETKNKSFPASAVSMRQVRKMSEYAEKEKADEKAYSYTARIAEKVAKEAEMLKAQKKDKVAKARIEREERKDAERNAYLNEARLFFEKELQELINPATGTTEAGKEPKAAQKAK
ncbi:MAG: hypothetical protein JXN60_04915 [Lentisphaerae bacterium]|nr:hypothetical protein [Lentisphaerota bacterium]